MPRPTLTGLALLLLIAAPARGDDGAAPKPAPAPTPDAGASPAPVSFLRDLAPLFVQNCVGCHNGRKSEGKYVMTTFAQLAKGGPVSQGECVVAGDPDASHFVASCQVDAEPRMPYKMDPLPPASIALIERWVKEGAKYDGASPTEEWLGALRRANPPVVPESYPAPVPITALAFAPDGGQVLASGYHELTAWGLADGTLKGRERGIGERTHDIAVSPDGKWLAAAGGDPGQYGSVRLWSLGADGSRTPAREFPEMLDSALAVAFSPDSTKLAAAGADRALRIWEVATGKELLLIEDHADWVFGLAWSPDGKRIATASRDKTSKVFDAEKREVLATFPTHGEIVYAVAFTPDGKQVVSAGNDNVLRVWTPDEEAKQAQVVGGFGGPIFRLKYAPDGKTLVATGADKVVRVFENLAPKHALTGHADWVYSLAVSPDGKTLASGGWDGEVRLWSLPDGKPIRQFVAAPGLGVKPAP